MGNTVYYQDKWVTITDKVVVTPQKTYDLSTISGLSIRYRVSAFVVVIIFLLSTIYLLLYFASGNPDPLPLVVGGSVFTIYGGSLLYFGHRKLIAYFAGAGSTVLITGVTYAQGQAIMYAFTLAKNS
jgi:hypothetical protein